MVAAVQRVGNNNNSNINENIRTDTGRSTVTTPPRKGAGESAMDSHYNDVHHHHHSRRSASSTGSSTSRSTATVKVTPPLSSLSNTGGMACRDDDEPQTTASSTDSVSAPHHDYEGKHVHFTGNGELGHDGHTSTGTSNDVDSPSRLVSRRGRYLSPSRRTKSSSTASTSSSTTTSGGHYTDSNRAHDEPETLLEFKTYRSPPRKREDEVPSLCSSSSEALTTASGATSGDHNSVAAMMLSNKERMSFGSGGRRQQQELPTSSISCDRSNVDTAASPLAGDTHDDHHHHHYNKKSGITYDEANATSAQQRDQDREQQADHSGFRRNMTPPPMKSPPRGTFQSLPNLHESNLMSPGGLFLSPNPPTPSHRSLIDPAASFEEKKQGSGDDEDNEAKPSPRRDRERFVSTPTDFSMDYGKDPSSSSSFDNSNVLAWLQSPSTAGLFSPGGFASLANTPGGPTAPRTPRTPTVSTSFFFSDVASLPRGDSLTPKDGGGSNKQQRGQKMSNIICISPMASSKARNGNSCSDTPVNLKDVFASPREKSKISSMPLLNDTPSKNIPRVPKRSSSKDPSLDVHMAERDLMEDEDLSVLLQLAANTPKSLGGAGATGGPVFRSPGSRRDGGDKDSDSNKLPSLQIPLIGGRDGDKRSRKSHSKDHGDSHDFQPPQLGMRSASSNGSKDMFVASKLSKDASKDHGNDGDNENTKPSKKSGHSKQNTHSYRSMHPPYPPHQDVPPFYSMPPQGIPPGPGGSMRVVVGGPIPRSKSNSGSPSRASLGGSPPLSHPPHFHEYPPPGMPYHPPPPHPGMYQQYPPGPPPPMGYPYQAHYPPPPVPSHRTAYSGAQQLPATSSKGAAGKKQKQLPKQNRGSIKRGSPPLPDHKTMGSNKKLKRTPSSGGGSVGERSGVNNNISGGGLGSGGSGKKKSKSSPGMEKAERQKAAVAIKNLNTNSGGKNDRAAALAAAILRGVTMRPSGKWQAQLYFAGKSRYIGVFDTREKAALAYEIAREKLKTGPLDPSGKSTENLVNAARKAAFEGVNERGSGSASAGGPSSSS